jgi:hypothetical protein
VLNLNDQHQHLLRLLGRPYEAFIHENVMGCAECRLEDFTKEGITFGKGVMPWAK